MHCLSFGVRPLGRLAGGFAAALLLAACKPLPSADAAAPLPITMWVHAGAGPEAQAYEAAIAAWNARQSAVRVTLVKLPEGSYGDQVNAAAFARRLPCLLDFDGPNVYGYAWTGKLLALDGFAQLAKARDDLLPSLRRQGTYAGRLYSMGQFDSGLALWGNRRLLQRAGVRIPNGVADAWSGAEFEAVLARLKAAGVPTPLDMKFNYGIGEWSTYGFSPLLQSFGGDLIERSGYRSARGVLNGPGAVRAMTLLQRWGKAGFIDPGSKDDAEFASGRAALSYVGHWTYRGNAQALGADLVLIPMPRFGARAVTGAGSWNFGISSDCRHPQAAADVLAFLMTPAEIARVTAANGAVPGTRGALAANRDYAAGGPLHVYAEQLLQGMAQVRPETPAYPAITTAFAEALNDILAGAEVQRTLDRAVARIDRHIEDNHGFPIGAPASKAASDGPPRTSRGADE